MLEKLKEFLTAVTDRRKLTAGEDFDELIQEVGKDNDDLSRLEACVRGEFGEIQEEIKNIRQGVDEAVREKPVV